MRTPRTFKTFGMGFLTAMLLMASAGTVRGQYSYTTNADNTITITEYTGTNGFVVTIPDTIDRLSVTCIGEDAFVNWNGLTNVVIGANVTNIWVWAFGCNLILPTITVDASNPVYSSLDGVLFDKKQTKLIEFPLGKDKVGSYTIPDSVNSIGDEAFSCCDLLTNVTIPDSVTNIGHQAFSCCLNLTSVTIPNKVTNIGQQGFASCINLTSVYFKGNAPAIGLYAFDYDTNAIIYYLSGTTGWSTNFAGRPAKVWKP